MKSKIAFILFLIGCAGVDGNFTVSALMIMISLFVLWKESKKNRRTHRQVETSIK